MSDRTLTIAIDGRELAGPRTGVGRYLAELLRCWAATGPDRVSWHVIVPAMPADAAAYGPQVTWTVRPASTAGTWWEQVTLRAEVARLRADVLFAPAYTAPLLAPCPVVLTVHDVSFFAHPEWFGWREGARRRLVTRAAARRARAVIAVSAFSADESAKYLGVGRDAIHVIPHGSPPVGSDDRPEPRPPLVLYAGTLFVRRRIPDLIEAFARVVARVPEARLVIVGADRSHPPIDPLALARARGVSSQVEWRRSASDAELTDLYRRARVFAFLSDYEGFALTPGEALAGGAAPILLDTAVAREVYGDGARLVPADPGAIAGAMADLLTDETARQALVRRGQDRLTRRSWPAAALAVRRLLEDAATPPR